MTLIRRALAARSRLHVLPWGGIWRQSRRDWAPLAVALVVVAVTAFLSAVLPPAMDAVAAAEVQAAVTSPDRPVDVVVTVPLDSGFQLSLDTAGTAETVKDQVTAALPARLRSVLADPVTALVGPELKAGAIADRPGRARFIYVADRSGPAVTWSEGRAPVATGDADALFADEPPPVEVAVSEATARLMGVRAGARLAVETAEGRPLEVWVSGVYRADDPRDAAWGVAPTLLQPQLVGGSAAVASVGLLVSPQSLPFAQIALFPASMTRTYTYPVGPPTWDSRLAVDVATEVRALASGRKVFDDLGGATPVVTTQLDRVIDDALGRVATASAQASVLLLGVLAAALLVEVLAAGLVVERRAAVIRQWRSRGATLPAIGLANAAESAAVAVAGGLVGLAAAGIVLAGAGAAAWILPGVLVAVLPQPILAMRAAAAATRRPAPVQASPGRRTPLTPARARRLAAEGMLVLVSGAALATLVVRGVTASAGSVWSDAVVLAAPVLVTLVVALGLVRLSPRAAAAARGVGARSPGVVPLLAAARTRPHGFATAALTTAVAVTAIAATVAGTVSQGRVDAAWDAVGADATVTTTAPEGLPPALARLDGTAGLTVATGTVISHVQVLGDGVDEFATVVAVDAAALGRLLAATPAPDAPALAQLAGPSTPVPALVAGGGEWRSATVRWGEESVALASRGAAPALPSQLDLADGPTIVVDREVLAAALGHPVPASLAWVVGEHADTAVAAALADTDAHVATRQAWLAARAASPLTRALGWLFAGGALTGMVLAALAVALMAASGAGERTLALARLRVTGTSRADAARVAGLEAVVPTVVASSVGLAVGIGLAGLLVTALDLASVTGGRAAPAVVIPWWCLAVPVALGVLARRAVAVAGSLGSRQPLGPLLRAG